MSGIASVPHGLTHRIAIALDYDLAALAESVHDTCNGFWDECQDCPHASWSVHAQYERDPLDGFDCEVPLPWQCPKAQQLINEAVKRFNE